MAQPEERRSPLTVQVACGDFSVGPRFVDLRPVGYGATGLVLSATDSDCDKHVAIKKLNFSDHAMCIQALREVRIMRQMEHENILTIYEILDATGTSLDHMVTPGVDSLHSMYIVQELMDADLSHLIHSGQLMAEHVKLLGYQLLRGLKYIHSANVLHRDLKPNNLLINCEDLVLKIADFGMARIVDPNYNHKGFLTPNVGSCWYRAPELTLHPCDYSEAIDIWSCGCVIAEMLLGHPLVPAAHELDTLRLVIDLIHLSDEGWNQVLSVMPNKMLKNHPLRARSPLSQVLADVDPLALDLVEKLLVFTPSQRLSAEEALAHPYFSQYACLWDEPVALRPFHIESEVDNLSSSQIKRLIVDENRGSHITCGSCVPVKCFCGLVGTERSPRSESPPTEEMHTLEEIMNIRAEGEDGTGVQGSGIDSLNRLNLRNTIGNIQEGMNILRIEEQEEESTDETHQGAKLKTKCQVELGAKIPDKDIDETVDRCPAFPPTAEPLHNVTLTNARLTPGAQAPSALLQQSELNMHSPESDMSSTEGENIHDWEMCLCQGGQVRPGYWCNHCEYASAEAIGLQVALENSHKQQQRIISTIPEDVTAEEGDDENLKEKLVAEKSPRRKPPRRHKTDTKLRRKKTKQQVLSSSEFDEMYRLPTEHLSRDFSNERLKGRHVGKAHHNRINEEINERLKEERQHGACGGEDDIQQTNNADICVEPWLAEQYPYFCFEHSAVLRNRRLENELRNSQISGNSNIEIGPHHWSDSSHSPEQPSSPRANSAGARPKRSPRKQKHKAV